MAKALDKPTFTIFSPWIEKESWSTFEDGIKNKAIHLKDYKPEVFKSKSRKELKNNSSYYNQFTPELFHAELVLFLKNNLD
jgi:heptosyltransferase-2